MKYFFIFLLLQSSVSWGQAPATPAAPAYTVSQADCTATDIRTSNPTISSNPDMVRHFSTPRDQDSIGWCYAFVASDLLSAEMGTPVSAMHTSILYNRTTYGSRSQRRAEERERAKKRLTTPQDLSFDEVYEGGWADDAIQRIRRNRWVCSEKGLPFDVNTSGEVEQIIQDLENLKTTGAALPKADQCLQIGNITQTYNLANDTINQIADSLFTENMNNTMNIFANGACTDKITNIPNVRFREMNKPSAGNENAVKRYMSNLNSALESGKPVSFDYHTNSIAIFSGYHASMIIGRRWNNGRCEYNVRNSWGASCASYQSHIQCNPTEGTFWLSDADFFSSSTGLRYVRN